MISKGSQLGQIGEVIALITLAGLLFGVPIVIAGVIILIIGKNRIIKN